MINVIVGRRAIVNVQPNKLDKRAIVVQVNKNALPAVGPVGNAVTHFWGGNTFGETGGISQGAIIHWAGSNISFSKSGNTVSVIGESGGIGGGGAAQTFRLAGNSAGVNTVIANPVFFHAGSNFTLSGSSNSISMYGPAQTVQTQNMVSVQGSAGPISFANGNGITFGGNNSTITASHNGITSQSVQTQGSVELLGSTGAISFANGNGITFGGNNSTITASHNGLTSQSGQALSGSNGSFAFQTATFGNLNGISFYTSNGSMVASHNGLTTARASNDGIGLATAQSNVTWTVNSAGLSLDGRGYAGTGTSATNASITLNSNGLQISIAPGGGGADGYNILAAGTQTAATTGTISFANSNGITFGMSNSSVITASHNGLTSQSNQALSGSNGSFTFQTASFGNLNGMSFYSSNGSLVASYTVPTQSVQTQNMVSVLGSAGAISFANGNGITFGGNNSTITASHNGLTSQSGQAISGSNGSFAFQTATFGNLNGISFYSSNGSMVASHNGLTTARASNDAVGLNTAGTNVTWTVNSSGISFNGGGYAGTGTSATNASITLNSNGLQISVAAPGGGGVTPVASASNGSFSFTTLAFSNANNITFGTSAGSIITASVAPPGAAAENNWFNLLGANTAGNTTASGSTIGLSGINLTISGTNGSVMNISAPAVSSLSATGKLSISVNGNTVSMGVPDDEVRSIYNPYGDLVYVAGGQGQGTLVMNPNVMPAITFDRVLLLNNMSNATNSSGSQTVSFWFGLYTKTGSTLSLLTSQSTSYAMTQSGTQGSYSLFSGMRHYSMGISTSISAGRYYMALISRSTSAGANATISQMQVSAVNSNFVGFFNSAHNTTMQLQWGLGVYSASTTAMPSSIGFSQIRGSDSIAFRPPVIIFANSTI
jgi:hypothetical protein